MLNEMNRKEIIGNIKAIKIENLVLKIQYLTRKFALKDHDHMG